MKLNRKKFEASIVAQDDDNDYDESGYAICVFPDLVPCECMIVNYSHCSCYGTWEAISGNSDYCWEDGGESCPDRDITPLFEGTIEQMIDLARNRKDPAMPERFALPDDHDYDHLMKVYEDFLKWVEATVEKTKNIPFEIVRCPDNRYKIVTTDGKFFWSRSCWTEQKNPDCGNYKTYKEVLGAFDRLVLNPSMWGNTRLRVGDDYDGCITAISPELLQILEGTNGN